MVPRAGGGTYCAVRIFIGLRLTPPSVTAARGAHPISDAALVARFTRNWIHYGFLGHTVLCVLIAAVEGLMGR